MPSFIRMLSGLEYKKDFKIIVVFALLIAQVTQHVGGASAQVTQRMGGAPAQVTDHEGEASAQVTHYVGGDAGWSLAADLDGWSASSTFNVGDLLEFVYTSEFNVVELSERDARECTAGNPLGVYDGGRTIITLQDAGSRYFTSTLVPHCEMILEIDVFPKA